ncbi:UNKNOWN [Stylonychia lemnae]|uniref:Transmembrane protein n=1 Tax=Stylonychia lemnae TaxID=5949 RepID=A0A078A2G3_STYLE|nr:UNKNOWN [Stylonychia lemnae]|eukprot:CDW76391.1 UNKNOWN [Stylonychia lemnae]
MVRTRPSTGQIQKKERLLSNASDLSQNQLAHNNSSIEDRWAARVINDTPMITQPQVKINNSVEKTLQIAIKLNSDSKIRMLLFNIKRAMIISPMADMTVTILAGFIVNVHFMIAIVIAFEKLTNNVLTYADSIIPLITLACLILFTCILSLIVLMMDLIYQGCLAWNRDSFGILFQKIIFSISLLMTTVNFYEYVQAAEESVIESEKLGISVFECFIPILVFFGLAIVKLLLFKVKYLPLNISIAVSILALSILVYYKFDFHIIHIPLFFVAIPISVILLTISMHQGHTLMFEKDQVKKLLYGYNKKFRIIFTVLSCYRRDLFQFVLLTSFFYFTFQMEYCGSLFLDTIFQQFYFDLVTEIRPPKTRYTQIFQKRPTKYMFEFDVSKDESSYELQDRSLNRSSSNSPSKSSPQKIVIKINKSITPNKKMVSTHELKKPLLNIQDDEEPRTP